MSSTQVSLGGRFPIWSTGDYVWHELHQSTPGYGGLVAYGTLTFSRDPSSTQIDFWRGRRKCS